MVVVKVGRDPGNASCTNGSKDLGDVSQLVRIPRRIDDDGLVSCRHNGRVRGIPAGGHDEHSLGDLNHCACHEALSAGRVLAAAGMAQPKIAMIQRRRDQLAIASHSRRILTNGTPLGIQGHCAPAISTRPPTRPRDCGGTDATD